jgi:hypothetical protein
MATARNNFGPITAELARNVKFSVVKLQYIQRYKLRTKIQSVRIKKY